VKKIKLLLCIVVCAAVSLFCPPKSEAGTYAGSKLPDKRAGAGGDSGSDSADPNQGRFSISPKYNCDPKMLIPGNPQIDPGFLIELPVEGKSAVKSTIKPVCTGGR